MVLDLYHLSNKKMLRVFKPSDKLIIDEIHEMKSNPKYAPLSDAEVDSYFNMDLELMPEIDLIKKLILSENQTNETGYRDCLLFIESANRCLTFYIEVDNDLSISYTLDNDSTVSMQEQFANSYETEDSTTYQIFAIHNNYTAIDCNPAEDVDSKLNKMALERSLKYLGKEFSIEMINSVNTLI